MRVARMGCRLVLRALTALALVVAPFHLSVEGFVVAKAYADKGGGNGNGGGNRGGGNGNGNSGGNNGSGNSGNGNSGGNSSGNSNSGGNSGNSNSGGNSGNSNSGGNSGNSNSGGNSGGNSGNSNSGGNSGNSKGAANSASNSAASSSTADVDDHVNALTGDKVEVSNNSIQVTHRNGMKETIENGRFRMEDKFGRTIVERRATMADLNRLKSL
ncbi:hypothetical protein RFN29_09040 [Mesorhizobium sp. VK22B]|uniref:Glycine-rich cell wall protein n=1 Tax=Mesorhizobium captivum TaxID=3072319 RepID=A0ABU4Z0W2_9HYPH|nr:MULTISPECIES: hypothetical protein [unclassified Mesorhizobium]MDX8491724.1 hypothetical protein [Mesorhizobium sp. VK22B]MDX8505034.1 hypothetical protein [Mesorhizobium sp. VK22E]